MAQDRAKGEVNQAKGKIQSKVGDAKAKAHKK